MVIEVNWEASKFQSRGTPTNILISTMFNMTIEIVFALGINHLLFLFFMSLNQVSILHKCFVRNNILVGSQRDTEFQYGPVWRSPGIVTVTPGVRDIEEVMEKWLSLEENSNLNCGMKLKCGGCTWLSS